MKVEVKLIVGVLALTGLGGAYYMSTKDKKARADKHALTAAADVPVVKISKEDAGKLTKFVLQNKDKGEVVLEKKGDKWTLSKPLAAKASQKDVDNLIENIQKFELKTQISTSAESYKKYELEGDKTVHVQAFAGADKKLDMYFGKQGTRGQMARIAGTDGVFTIDGYSGYLWGREVKNWRDSEIIKFEDANAVAVEVLNKNGRFSFTKADDKWSGAFYERDEDGDLAKKPSDWEKFDEAKVKDMLRAYKNLKATDYAADGAETGVDKPVVEGGLLRITMKDDAAGYELSVGSGQEGSNRYVSKKGGDGTIYVIGSWAADWALAEPKKFEKTEAPEGGPPKGMPKMPMGMPGMPGMPGGR